MAAGTVREGSAGGNVPVLVVRYEYTPLVGDLDGYTIGGRGTVWLGDTLALARPRSAIPWKKPTRHCWAPMRCCGSLRALMPRQKSRRAKAADLRSPTPSTAACPSSISPAPAAGVTAQAYRAEVAMNFAELAGRQGDLGTISASFEHLRRRLLRRWTSCTDTDERWGMAASLPLGSTGAFSASYDEFSAETHRQQPHRRSGYLQHLRSSQRIS